MKEVNAYRATLVCLAMLAMVPVGFAFQSAGISSRISPSILQAHHRHRTITINEPRQEEEDNATIKANNLLPTVLAATAITTLPTSALAQINMKSLQTGLTPENFQPVCGASDGIYRVLQETTAGLVGAENFAEYGPLIAGGLLRVRLELCVLESFFNEAVYPFVRDNGLSWILPIHETVETFLAGIVFCVATTFILIGSTKILTVLVTYTDFLFGLPSRIFGGFAFDRAQGKPVTLDIGLGPFKTRVIGPPAEEEIKKVDLTNTSPLGIVVLLLSGIVNYFGQALGFIRECLEAVDGFVGRYLVLWASFYLIIKFLHFKVFPDFP